MMLSVIFDRGYTGKTKWFCSLLMTLLLLVSFATSPTWAQETKDVTASQKEEVGEETVEVTATQKEETGEEAIEYTTTYLERVDTVTATYQNFDCNRAKDVAANNNINIDTDNKNCEVVGPCDPSAGIFCSGNTNNLCQEMSICVPTIGNDTSGATANGQCIKVPAHDCSNLANDPLYTQYASCNVIQCNTKTLQGTDANGNQISQLVAECALTPNSAGSACNTGDACVLGSCSEPKLPTGNGTSDEVSSKKYSICEGTAPIFCASENSCQIARCDSSVTSGSPCVFDTAPVGTPCNPNLFSADDACKQFTCQAAPGGVPTCQSGDPIPLGACQECQGGEITAKENCTTCETPGACDDGNPCTINQCESGACQIKFQPNGYAVSGDDENCSLQVCDGKGGINTEIKSPPLDVSQPCTDYECKLSTVPTEAGEVSLTWEPKAVPNGPHASCDSGLFCDPSVCQAGKCVAKKSVDSGFQVCPTSKPCYQVTCNEDNNSCDTTSIANCCSADEDCNLADVAPGSSASCATATCVNKTCVVDTASKDGQACGGSANNQCAGSVCSAGNCLDFKKVCESDLNPCTDTHCDPASGCVSVNNTNSCDDGKRCTNNDQCSDGSCQGDAVVCPDPETACKGPTTCQETATGQLCQYPDTPNCETSCDAMNCDDGDPCTEDQCVVDAAGKAKCQNTAKSGGQCDDKDACTSEDSCVDGLCVGKKIDEVTACKVTTCSNGNVTVQYPSGTPCDLGDICKLGQCDGKGICVDAGASDLCPDDTPGDTPPNTPQDPGKVVVPTSNEVGGSGNNGGAGGGTMLEGSGGCFSQLQAAPIGGLGNAWFWGISLLSITLIRRRRTR